MITSPTRASTAARNQRDNLESVKDIGITLLHKGDCLYRMGDSLKGIYLVNVGAIKLSRTTENGDEQISGFYLPGDIIGMDALSDGRSRNQAVALDTTSVRLVPFRDLDHGRDRLSADQLLRHMSAEINRDRDLMLMLSQRTADRRLAWFLVEFSGKLEQRGLVGDEFTLPMTRTDLAAYLGLALETVCRELAAFEEAGLVRKHRRRIELLDMESIRHRQRLRQCPGRLPALKALDTKDLASLREALETRAVELLSQIEEQRHSVEDSGEMESGGADRGEESQQEFDVTLALAQAEHDSEELLEIRQALAAMESGDYGTCVDCDETIPVARLRANPSASRCIRCQEALENDQDERDATPSL